MKKTLIIVFSIAALGFIASQALAACWDGYYGGGYGPGGYYGADKNYLNETASIRQELAAKQGEYNALMTQTNPDPKKAGELSKEIVTLQDQLAAKGPAGNFSGPRGYGNGYCPGWGGQW